MKLAGRPHLAPDLMFPRSMWPTVLRHELSIRSFTPPRQMRHTRGLDKGLQCANLCVDFVRDLLLVVVVVLVAKR
jgi:hypothetical protein